MNYVNHKTRPVARLAIALLSLVITVGITGGIVFGMAGGPGSGGLAQMAAKKLPQVVAAR